MGCPTLTRAFAERAVSREPAPRRVWLVAAFVTGALGYILLASLFGLPPEGIDVVAWVITLPLSALLAGLVDPRRALLWGITLGVTPFLVWLVLAARMGSFGLLGPLGLLIPLLVGLLAGVYGAVLGWWLRMRLSKAPKHRINPQSGAR